jgi:hypothetical protein
MIRAVSSARNRRGATLIEYAVLAGLVALALATAIMIAGQRTARSYGTGEEPGAPVQESPANPR